MSWASDCQSSNRPPPLHLFFRTFRVAGLHCRFTCWSAQTLNRPLTHAAGHRVPAGNHACPVLALSCRSVRLGRAGQCLVGQSLGRGAHVPAVQNQTGERSREPRRLQAFLQCFACGVNGRPEGPPIPLSSGWPQQSQPAGAVSCWALPGSAHHVPAPPHAQRPARRFSQRPQGRQTPYRPPVAGY